MKAKTNQRKTIERDYPYTLENLMKISAKKCINKYIYLGPFLAK